ncbi:MAG: hypothetical protein K6L75_09305 [Cellvibrionaceae bacterium]
MSQTPAALASYQFNIRSFHPEKNFGWSGLNFSGDNRGFSLKPSGKGMVTSRIWHRFNLNTADGGILLDKTTSDDSHAPWSPKPFPYDDPDLNPRSNIFRIPPQKTPNGKINLRAQGRYYGSNHAMPGSPAMQKSIGTTYVPDINVGYEIFVTVDPRASHIDIGILVTGDGFPNTEAFIVDPQGTPVFLGTHVREGAAPVTLAANFTHKLFGNVIRLPINVNGNFVGTVEDEGGRFVKKSTKKIIYSISDWNKKFLDSNPNASHCMGLEDIKRIKECF